MKESNLKLSAKSIAILTMIADANSYEQILAAHSDFTYWDIFNAAKEALAQDTKEVAQPKNTLAQKHERHARAYEMWTDEEDATLRQLIQTGETVARIAGALQRNRGAIRSRIIKLNLISELSTEEQARFNRIIDRDDLQQNEGGHKL